MHRILIFGAAGSGTTTLAKKLSESLNISHFDSDEYYWVKTDPPYTIKSDVIERQTKLKADLEKEKNWVASGSLHSWGTFIAEMLTQAVFLYVPTEARMRRIKLREQKRFGDRIEEGGDMYEHHQAFLDWAASYDDTNHSSSRTKAKHLTWANSLSSPVLRIDGDEAINIVLKRVLSWIEQDFKQA